MINFSIHQLFPDFILEDKNGFAMAKAIEKMLQIMCDTVRNGVDTVKDVEKMPEWRLDELAWEYNCPYDYNADVEKKRRWIRDANTLNSLYGTREAIYQYLIGYFDDVKLEEAREYGGDPFHFRLIFTGLWDTDKVTWATNAINMVKNVRSVLDYYNFKNKWDMLVYAGCALYGESKGVFHVPTVALDEVRWYVDEVEDMLTDENGLIFFVEG